MRPSLALRGAITAVLLLLAWPLPAPGGDVPTPANVLVLYSENRILPANFEVDHGLNLATRHGDEASARFFAEYLDAPAFFGEGYESRTAAYLKEKYATQAPRVIVAAGEFALGFFLRHRAAIFPDAPIVFLGVGRHYLSGRKLPPDVVGVPTDYDVRGTLELAFRLQPDARRLVIVTGASSWGRDREALTRAAIVQLSPSMPVEYLAGLASDDLVARLKSLDRHTIVFTPGYFRDGAGRTFTPRESVEMMAGESGAPLYVLFSSQIGTGAVGGRMTSFIEMGRAAGTLVDRIIKGTPVTSLTVPSALPTLVQLDWRQLGRWKIPASRVPDGATLNFREPTFWEAYRTQAIITFAVMLVQAGLIAALLVQGRLRRRTALALAESEQQIKLAAQSARLTPFAWNLAGETPAGAANHHGGAVAPLRDEVNFREVLGSVHPADRERLESAVRRAAAIETEFDVEYRSTRPSGEDCWLASRGHAAAGEPDRVIGVSMDVTARKQAELQAEADRAALTHLSRVSTLGQLSAAIAHQLNQPLASILGNAETARKMLARGDASPGEMAEILDDIVAEDHRAAEVIRRLGALYRRGDVELATVDLNELARETLDLLRSEFVRRHLILAFEPAPSLPAVQASRIQLQQVLLNLLLNAADATGDAEADRRTIVVRTACNGRFAELSVLDRGPGIPAGDLAHVFKPFWTTKSSGLGVGLAICQAIATAHHGTMAAANNADGGATFRLALPLAPDARESGAHA